jgi:hypothetical protein
MIRALGMPLRVSLRIFLCLSIGLGCSAPRVARAEGEELPRPRGPQPGERQLPEAMRSAMKELPAIRVGAREGDLIGSDNRALQAAVDYVAGLGGGTVEIGAGVYLMRDSLHLRSGVTVRGRGAETVLRKAVAAVSPLALDGDYGEEQVTVEKPEGFQVGDGVAVWDSGSGGFHTTVARITGKNGNTFSISRHLNADCMVGGKAQAATVFPVVSGYDLTDARVERLTIDGAKEKNVPLNGCRGAGIFLYRAHRTVLQDCLVRGYNGDGISFQQSNDVQVLDCRSEGNAGLGIHPGSGSQRPTVRGCLARGNGGDGLYLCWRVRHGLFEGNQLLENGGYGISIGHKDSDNLLRRNLVRANGSHGIYFRNEAEGMAGHRNRLEENTIEDNGRKAEAAGIAIDGETDGVVISGNRIRDTRAGDERRQRTAIRIGKRAGEVRIEKNELQADHEVENLRAPAGGDRAPGR